MPMASTRPNIDSVFTEKPSSGKKMNVPSSDTGTVSEGNERRAEVLQEDEDDQRDEDDRLEEGVDDRLDRRFHRRRRVVDDLVVEVRREDLLGVLHGLVDRLGGLQLVRAGQQIDRHRAAGLAVQPAEGVVVLRAELRPPHVLHADDRAGLGLADDDVVELLRGDEASRERLTV